MSKSIFIIFICNHKFIIVYLSCNLNIENFSIFTFTVTFIFSIFSSGKLHYLGYMHNWLNNRSRMIIPHVCWLKVYLLCSRILILWMWSNMCYIEVHDDGFSVAGKPRNFCSSLQRPRIADDASIRAFIRSFQSYSRTDSSNCIVKKFGESWINGRRNDRSFSMVETLRRIVEIFPPPTPPIPSTRICPIIYAVDFTGWDCWHWTYCQSAPQFTARDALFKFRVYQKI